MLPDGQRTPSPPTSAPLNGGAPERTSLPEIPPKGRRGNQKHMSSETERDAVEASPTVSPLVTPHTVPLPSLHVGGPSILVSPPVSPVPPTSGAAYPHTSADSVSSVEMAECGTAAASWTTRQKMRGAEVSFPEFPSIEAGLTPSNLYGGSYFKSSAPHFSHTVPSSRPITASYRGEDRLGHFTSPVEGPNSAQLSASHASHSLPNHLDSTTKDSSRYRASVSTSQDIINFYRGGPPGASHRSEDNPYAATMSTEYVSDGEEQQRARGICRIPLTVAVMGNIIVTVVLVAVLTIVPLNAVSLQSIDHVAMTMSLSLSRSYAESIYATMMFLPYAVRGFSSAWMFSATTAGWAWSNEDMEQAMQQLCKTVLSPGRPATLLYMTMSSPLSGYSAYCSQQYSDDYLVGNFIKNGSSFRYLINRSSFKYTDPPVPFYAVNSMTAYENTVDFGGAQNPWNEVVVPWFEEIKAGTLSQTRSIEIKYSGRRLPVTAEIDVPSAANISSMSDSTGYWMDFTVDNTSIVTYTWPFVDYNGNPAMISAALQPEAIQSIFSEDLVSTDGFSRGMVVDLSSGAVLTNSWGEGITVMLDSWNKTCPCLADLKIPKALYINDIVDPLMKAAVVELGGLQGLTSRPRELNRWILQFSGDAGDIITVVNRVNMGTISNRTDINLVVIYMIVKQAFTENVDDVQKAIMGAVMAVLVIMVLVDLVMLYLFIQPLRGVALGLRAAAQLRDGREHVDTFTSIIKEVGDMQHDFCVMNAQLIRMKAFLPQGMLGPTGQPVTGSDFGSSFCEGMTPGELGGHKIGGDTVLGGDSSSDEDILREEEVNGAVPRRRRGRHLTDGTNLQLNERVLLDEVNHFRRRYCSVAVFSMHLLETDVELRFLNEHCAFFMETVLPCVLKYGGIIELQRPDLIAVSFGAHNKVALHQSIAAKCALEVIHLLNTMTPIGERAGCLLDAREHYVGTCGAAHRNALVTYSHGYPVHGDLVKLFKSLQTQIILTQGIASTLDDSMLVIPIDCIVLNSIGSKETILYELRGHVRALPPEVNETTIRQIIRGVRVGFVKMLKGDYDGALSVLSAYEGYERQAGRLCNICRVMVSRHTHAPFSRSVNRLRFTEAHFNGYNEMAASTALGVTSSQAGGLNMSGTTHSTHFTQNGLGIENPLMASQSNAAQSYRFSPFLKEVDPTRFFSTSPSMRLVAGSSIEDSPLPLNATSLSPQRTSLHITDARGRCGETGSATASDAGSTVALENSAEPAPPVAAADEDLQQETALFEMFVMDDPDDRVEDGEKGFNRNANGAGGGDLSGSNRGGAGEPASQQNIGELPISFVDYEGNTWKRSFDRLGSGAFATVYRGLSSSGNLVALKCFQLRARNIDVLSIAAEVRVFANLHHENVVQYLSLYASDCYLIEIMEFLPGGSLDTLLHSFGSLPVESVRRYLRDIVSGLAYLHSMDIVHCDIKPHNVLLAMDGQCKLSDFGSAIAQAASSVCKIDDVLEMRGTPGYVSPEVARGDVPTKKSDVYSLGVTVLELLTGSLPWAYRDGKGDTDESAVEATHIKEEEATSRSQSKDNEIKETPSVTVASLPECCNSNETSTQLHTGSQQPTSADSTSQRTVSAGTPLSLKRHTSKPSGILKPSRRRPIEQVIRNSTQLIVHISRGLVVPHIPDTLNDDIIDFLTLCLHANPEERATTEELARHPWLM